MLNAYVFEYSNNARSFFLLDLYIIIVSFPFVRFRSRILLMKSIEVKLLCYNYLHYIVCQLINLLSREKHL